MSDDAVQQFNNYLASYAAGDIDALRGYFSDDVVWRVGGKHRLSGTYRGIEELLGYFKEVRDMTGGSLKLEPESILSGGQHDAMLTKVTGERDGKSLDVTMAQVFKKGDGGKWSEYWALADDQDAVDAFWS